MAVGRQSSSSVTIAVDDAPNGTPRQIENFILDLGPVKITAGIESSTAFGDAWEEHVGNGMRKIDPITLGGFFDTTTVTGPHVVFLTPDFDPNGGTRTLTIVFGDSKTFSVECRLVSYTVDGKTNALTKFSAVLQPTGVGAWT